MGWRTSKGKQELAEAKLFVLDLLSSGCPPKVLPTEGAAHVRVAPLILNNQDKKISHGHTNWLAFLLVPDPVKLATKVTHHRG